MTERSGPFSSTTDFGEDDWRRWQRVFSPDGVHGGYGTTGLAVSASGDGLSINIAVGSASVQGFVYNNDAILNKTDTANGAGSARPDRVVVRMDPTANSILATVREGTAGGSAPPALTQVATGQWDIPLARWSRAAGGGIGSLVDERQFVTRSGGVVMADAAITATVPLTALMPDASVGTTVTTLPSAREYRWSGTFWERIDSAELLYVTDGLPSSASNTSYLSGTPSGTFIAPLSGRVKVHLTAIMTPDGTASIQYAVRITGPGGYDAGLSDTAAVTFGDMRGVSATYYVAGGLTPGATYTATGYYKTTGGTGLWQVRRILVERA